MRTDHCRMRILLLAFILVPGLSAHSQKLPSPEEFVNAIYRTVVDTTVSHYFLVTGTDTCFFVKFEYDEWIKYSLKEPLPVNIMNELSEKVYLSRYPYYWRQPLLQKAICITRHQADSIIAPGPPNHPRPLSERILYSFSLPQFTDDGKYAVIDLNVVCGTTCGKGLTCLFRRTSTGWKLIGRHVNWSS